MTDSIPPNHVPVTVEEAVRWWERRRLLFNAILFAVGVVSFAGTLVMMDLMPREPGEDPGDFLGMCCAVPVYAVLANVCYTAGSSMERRRPMDDPVAAQDRREKLFHDGIVFSCVLTAIPFLLTALACAVSWFQAK